MRLTHYIIEKAVEFNLTRKFVGINSRYLTAREKALRKAHTFTPDKKKRRLTTIQKAGKNAGAINEMLKTESLGKTLLTRAFRGGEHRPFPRNGNKMIGRPPQKEDIVVEKTDSPKAVQLKFEFK